MKRAIKYFLIIISIAIISGCCHKQILKSERIVTITNTIHDTTVFTRTDSAAIIALVKCDSAGNAYLNTIATMNGRITKPEIHIRDNYITAECKVDSEGVYLRWKEKFINDSIRTVVTEYISKPFTWWQTTQIWIGRIWSVALLLVILYLLITFIIKRKLI